MKLYRITAMLISPLMVRRERQSYAASALSYLPGSSLRGALATQYLRLGGSPEDNAFRSLFLERPAHFPNLLPAHGGDCVPQVLPMTAISCKREPGFISQGGHGVGDSLAATATSKAAGGRITDDLFLCHCTVGANRKCHSEMTPFSGFWNSDLLDPRESQFTMQYQRHTGIDRDTGTAAASIFFVSQAMDDICGPNSNRSQDDRPQCLSGTIYLEDAQLKVLEELLHGPVFAGASRTRGFGELGLTISAATPTPWDIQKWSNRFAGRMEALSSQPPRYHAYFTIKLDSHAILMDRFLRPTSEFMPDFPGVELVKRCVGASVIRGWNSAWGLAKPDDTGLSMGSVFLFRYMGEHLEGLRDYLMDLTVTGIGLRREEGFGRISVCEAFHLIEGVI